MVNSNLHVVIGMGVTGVSCVRYLRELGIPVAVTDTRVSPPNLADFQKNFPDVLVSLGKLDSLLLEQAEIIVISPGISLKEPAIAAQIARGVPVVGDIELFARANTAPVIAITGTNAKSTVTTLVDLMAKAAGFNAVAGGNLGTPVLDLLKNNSQADVFVLELSSFQLETTYSLKPVVASILNITPDHMDRYEILENYKQAKHRVYQHAKVAVCNRDDVLTDTNIAHKLLFTLNTPNKNEFGLIARDGEIYLAFEDQSLLSVKELPVIGKHYQANALASLAIGYGFGLPFEPMLKVLREFKGLPHRCQLVRERNGVRWYNDSKGTNVGATEAAIVGLGSEINGKLILIAGGIGKNADFRVLTPVIAKYARHVVLIGEAAKEIADAIGNTTAYTFANTMEEAVEQSDAAAEAGDSVLLSPACASFDMFKNYEHRGEVFTGIVEKL